MMIIDDPWAQTYAVFGEPYLPWVGTCKLCGTSSIWSKNAQRGLPQRDRGCLYCAGRSKLLPMPTDRVRALQAAWRVGGDDAVVGDLDPSRDARSAALWERMMDKGFDGIPRQVFVEATLVHTRWKAEDLIP